MQKTFYILTIVVMIITACQPKTKTSPVDNEAAKAAISALFDKYNSALNAKDVNALTALLTDDALGCGTDPSEFWDKKQISEVWTQSFADTLFTINYSIDTRNIKLAADGNSAIVVEQYILMGLSPKIPIRSIQHAIKTGENWMIDFLSWNFIPKNEDIEKLNKALE